MCWTSFLWVAPLVVWLLKLNSQFFGEGKLLPIDETTNIILPWGFRNKTVKNCAARHEASGSADQLIKIWDVSDGSCTIFRHQWWWVLAKKANPLPKTNQNKSSENRPELPKKERSRNKNQTSWLSPCFQG